MLKKTILIVCHPVHTIADVVHQAHGLQKKHARFLVGATFMFAGSGLAISASEWGLSHAQHLLLDVTAYGIHGLGATPFVLVFAKKLKLEGDEH